MVSNTIQIKCCKCSKLYNDDELVGVDQILEVQGLPCLICSKCSGMEEEEEEDVCCVGCNEVVCKFSEEPPHKDSRGEAVCEECSIFLPEEKYCSLCEGIIGGDDADINCNCGNDD